MVVAAASKPTASWLGVGIMGEQMAGRLLDAGYPLVVWNRSPEKCAPLESKGAVRVDTPQEAVERSEGLVFAMLADPAAARAVAAQAAPASRGKAYIDISTVDAETSRAIEAEVVKAGGRFLEAPVSGSKKPATDGTLIFLTGGSREVFDEAQGALDVMGKAALYLGEVGAGAKMKLVINMLMGSMTVCLSEALKLTEGAGLQKKDFLEVLGLGACAAPYLVMKGPNMAEGKFPTAFPLKHQAKDLRLAVELSKSVGAELPLAEQTYATYEKALELGLGDEDASAVVKAVLS